MSDNPKPTATNTPKEKKGKPRPGNGDILVLLVGINEYANPKIADLDGCVTDLDKVENWLKKRFKADTGSKVDDFTTVYQLAEEGYGKLSVYRLADDKATYDNIVHAFRNFLGNAREVDRVWFHFSGHGMEATTAKEFAKLENNKDQCLLCHDTTVEQNGKLKKLLADKELAVLINEIAQGEGGTPHIVATIDCCHSGGGTRDKDLSDPMKKVRKVVSKDLVNAKANGEKPKVEARALSDYLDGHYSATNLEIPGAPHLVMTACNNLQLAGEGTIAGDTISGGYFTSSLIDALDSVGGEISYADLLIRTRHTVREQRATQTPQFEAIGGAKPYTRFLEGTPEGSPDKFEVKLNGGQWTIGCGAIHGLPTAAKINSLAAGSQPVEVTILSTQEETMNEVVAKATISEVGPQFSYLTGVEEILADKENQIFFGTLNYLPADSAFVLLRGEADGISNFQKDWDAFDKMKEMNIHYVMEGTPKVAHITVNVYANGYRIKHGEKMLDGLYPLGDADKVLLNIVQIVRWQRLLDLDNPTSALKDKVKLSLSVSGKAGPSNPIVENLTGENVTFIAKEADKVITRRARRNKRYFHLLPKITVEGVTDPVYCYLLSLYPFYRISGEIKEGEVRDGITEFPYDTKRSTGLDSEENQYFHIFKLIVSEEKLDIHQFYQDGIYPNTKGFEEDLEPIESGFKDWCVVNMRLDVVREEFAETFFQEQEVIPESV